MPFGETEADQTVALPHSDETRSAAQYVDPHDSMGAPCGVGLPGAMVGLAVIFLAIALCAAVIAWSLL